MGNTRTCTATLTTIANTLQRASMLLLLPCCEADSSSSLRCHFTEPHTHASHCAMFHLVHSLMMLTGCHIWQTSALPLFVCWLSLRQRWPSPIVYMVCNCWVSGLYGNNGLSEDVSGVTLNIIAPTLNTYKVFSTLTFPWWVYVWGKGDDNESWPGLCVHLWE